ncbi:MAG: hypothetical protein LC753_12270 [Acidobacteria bacterium]|nr:hypothetical protein [Acidobacteriota bacterium]MCA1651012.1 hypothetical protein [Acidobacteriota bacterium]
MSCALQDLRYALRTLRRNPVFTCVAVLALALGIGVNISIFTLIHALFLTPIPYARPEQLGRVYGHSLDGRATTLFASVPKYERFNSRAPFARADGAVRPLSERRWD